MFRLPGQRYLCTTYEIYRRPSSSHLAYPRHDGGTDEAAAWRNRMSTIVPVILILLLIGALPTWPYSRSWGYYPSGGLGLIVLILLVLALSGRV